MAMGITPPLGSHDDNPDQVSIPGLKEKALTPDQKKALDCLRALKEHRKNAKEVRRQLKDREQELLEETFEVLDGLELVAGKIGPATFRSKVIRKLELEIAEKKKASK
jgi:hypothetical protein